MSNSFTVLEIGSGSFKLHKNGHFSARYKSALGKDLKDDKLSDESIEIALKSVEERIIPFLKEHEIELGELLVFATAAVRRSAKNATGKRFLSSLKDLGVPRVKIFTEDEECEYAAWAVIEELNEIYKDLQILDTGGASHQLIEVRNSEIVRKISVPIGSHSDLTQHNMPDFSRMGFSVGMPIAVIGTSGVILNNIANISRANLKMIQKELEAMTIEQRRDFLEELLLDDTTYPLLVDYRLKVMPVAFKIILNCAESLRSPSFILSKKQAMDYISANGFIDHQ